MKAAAFADPEGKKDGAGVKFIRGFTRVQVCIATTTGNSRSGMPVYWAILDRLRVQSPFMDQEIDDLIHALTFA